MCIFDDVASFHKATDQELPKELNLASNDYVRHKNLVKEEYEELTQAILMCNALGITKEAIDLIYVTVGLLYSMGIDPKKAWELVHESNMKKVENGIVKDATGKVKKPIGWTPPDMTQALVNKKDVTYFHRCNWMQLDDGWYLQDEFGQCVKYYKTLWIHYQTEGEKAKLIDIGSEEEVRRNYEQKQKTLREAYHCSSEDDGSIAIAIERMNLLQVEYGRPEDINIISDGSLHPLCLFHSLGRSFFPMIVRKRRCKACGKSIRARRVKIRGQIYTMLACDDCDIVWYLA